MELKDIAGQPMYEGALVELATLAMQTYQALQRGRPLMYGGDAALANANSDIVRLIMIALERLINPIDTPHSETPPPAWLASLWEDK